MPVNRSITHVRGDTMAFDIRFSDLQATVESIDFSVKKKPGSEYAVHKTLGDGITEIDTDVYRVRIAPEDTATLSAGKYFYDLQIGLGADIYTPLLGTFMLVQDATEEMG